jgi:hypothetical protein
MLLHAAPLKRKLACTCNMLPSTVWIVYRCTGVLVHWCFINTYGTGSKARPMETWIPNDKMADNINPIHTKQTKIILQH